MNDIKDLYRRVDAALDTIRPHLKVDGGNVELVEITDTLCAKVRWQGTCETCNMSVMTMKAGVEQAIKSQVPEILSVEALNGIFA